MFVEYPKIETLFELDKENYPLALNDWQWTEKIDGMNISICWDGSPNYKIYGRTVASEVPKKIEEYIRDNLNVEEATQLFGAASVIIYGEGCGGKIQGGEKDKERGGKYSENEKFVIFDILNLKLPGWVNPELLKYTGKKIGLPTVPFLEIENFPTLVKKVRSGFNSLLNSSIKAEGVVGRWPYSTSDLNRYKLKTRDFVD